MPLPDGTRATANTPWPPLATLPALDRMTGWSAWYSGDPDELQRVYQRIDQRMTPAGATIRPSQYRGGIVGWLARTFWGAPPNPTEPRTKLHIPLPADIAQVSAELLFAEPITVKHEDTATQDKLLEILDDKVQASLMEAGEVCAGLGGVYLRAVWDRDFRDTGPWWSAIHADAAVPVWSYGELREVTFWRILKQTDNVVVRWLEKHEKGAIYHRVYQGSPTTLGLAVPLTEHDETKIFADVVDDEGKIDTGIELLTAAYVPNVRPNRLWRNQPANAPLGRSDFAGCELEFDALDEVYSSWMRDIRLAKARLIVPSVYLQGKGPGQGAEFDLDREVYEGVNVLPNGEGSSPITLAQFEIRVEEHERTAMNLTRKAITTAGYSEQSFGLTGEVAITATEVAARYRKSLSTRDKKIIYWRPEIAYMLLVIQQLGAAHFAWKVDTEDRPEVIFPDAIQPDPEATARMIQMLDAARAASTETKVMLANPDRKDDEEWIKQEVKRIHEENQIGAQFEDPGTFRGGPPAAANGKPPVDDPDDVDKPPSGNGQQPPPRKAPAGQSG